MRTPLKHSAYAVGAGLAALALASAATAPGAYAAAEGDIDVVNTETVQVYVEPDGSIESQRVYEQLTLTGTGTTEIANPIEEQGLRNLNGFGTGDVEAGVQNLEVDVDGVERLRSVSDYTGDLPLDISVEYRLDGELVDPGDVVGSDGELEVLYTAKNITAQPQEVTFPDGRGGTVTETVDVPIPMVGSLTTVAPPSFTEVTSEQANMAGDGKGGTKLSFTMTLFPPIGSDTAEFGYTAKISDGVVPSSSVSALPVNPLQSPSFKTAGESYQAGSDTGVKLAEGAAEIDMNLLKLRDGAATLLGGLIQLSDGADQLSSGLAGEAAPGARQLADGAGELDEGLGKIDDGAGKLADGAGRLSEGTGQLDDGAGRLSDGASDLAQGQAALKAGLRKLESGVSMLPATVRKNLRKNDDYNALLNAMKATTFAIGNPKQLTNPLSGQPSLYGALVGVRAGLRSPAGYANNDCMVALGGGEPARCGAMDAVQRISELLADAGPKVTALVGGAGSIYDYVASTSGGACAPRGAQEELPPPGALQSPHPACVGAAQVAYGLGAPPSEANPLGGLRAQTGAASGALARVYGKVDQEMIAEGLNVLLGKIYNPGANADCAIGAKTSVGSDDCGLQQAVAFFRSSIPTLVDGISGSVAEGLLSNISVPSGGCDPDQPTLLCGSGLLADGSSKLAAGAGDLAAGTGQLRAGAGELSAGAGKLAAGTGAASDGSGKLSAGAEKLADGLGEAADGSVRLADGLAKAEDGAPALVDGAGRLSDEGMSKLIGAGEDTAQDYGKLYATIEAGAERADAERMAYGAPADAQGLTAYTYELLGDDGETGRNTTRGLAALGLLGLGGGAFLLRRRFI